ncbi:MAG: rhomboid family intramembrane serine protease [Candidatus Kapabacteria bacterium]|nr:rhomboid family intramembrane serine protease [Candidatus Kapabacteria bacterium]
MSNTFGAGRGYSVFPPFIKFLLIANVAIYLVQSVFLTGLTFGGRPIDDTVMSLFALWPLESGFMPWQLITYQFMHGSIGHLFFNMLALWMFGMELENLWGTKKFATYYLLCGIAAGALHIGISPLLKDVLGPTIGASGSIMGVLLAFGLTFPTRPVMMFPIFFPIPARIFVLLYAGIDLLSGVFNTGDGVAHFAHLGGALGGWLLLKFGDPLFRFVDKASDGVPRGLRNEDEIIEAEYRDVPQRNERRDALIHTMPMPKVTSTPTRFVADGVPVTQERIDEILDKISQAGYHSLTENEKRVLFEVSRQL